MRAARICLLGVLASAAMHAAEPELPDIDCSNLRPVGARPGPDDAPREYRFAGTCRLLVHSALELRVIGTFLVEALGVWNVRTRRYTETVRVPGGLRIDGKTIGGVMRSEFTCSDDPLAAAAACNGFRHQNDTSVDALSNPYRQKGRPLLVGRR